MNKIFFMNDLNKNCKFINLKSGIFREILLFYWFISVLWFLKINFSIIQLELLRKKLSKKTSKINCFPFFKNGGQAGIDYAA